VSQENVARIAEEQNKDNLIAIWGISDIQPLIIGAITINKGDCFGFSGALANKELGLKSYHVLEPEIIAAIPQTIYAQEIMFIELSKDPSKLQMIFEIMRALRDSATLDKLMSKIENHDESSGPLMNEILKSVNPKFALPK